MLLQAALQLIPALAAGMIACLMCALRLSLKNGGTGMCQNLYWLLEKTPALEAFLLFVVQAGSTVVSVGSFRRISNSIVISLDILYFLSVLMLILYHILTEWGRLPVKEV
ncbi:MAG: hypothetical protein QHH06_13700 [Clostridiales bacterium]|nr:hypothetical protein [Eubacteriales bacterium]MDH7567496.1 hypothetical protein [Clostridiales bacterium]